MAQPETRELAGGLVSDDTPLADAGSGASTSVAPGEVVTDFRVIRLDAAPSAVTPAENHQVAPGEVRTDFRVIRLDGPAPAAAAPSPGAPASETEDAETAAPRRAKPLAAPTAKELAAAREIAAAAARPRLAADAAAKRARRPRIESKLERAVDSEEILRVMDVEVALYRAQRLSGAGDKQRELFRVLSVFMFCGLAITVVAAMWYLQTLKEGQTKTARHQPAAVSNRR